MTNPIITHPLSPSDAKFMQTVRSMLAGSPQLSFEPASRPAFDAIMGQAPAPEGVRFEPGRVGGVPGWWARPQGAGDGSVLLYLHGGGYVLGSLNTHRSLVGRLAQRARCAALSINYRKAPDHPFPAALDDARRAYQWLLRQGHAPQSIIVAGDSAGGGLALALLLALREAGQPLPAAAVGLSPCRSPCPSTTAARQPVSSSVSQASSHQA